MKKIISFGILVFGHLMGNAQSYHLPDGTSLSREFIDIPSMILVAFLLAMVILTVIKLILNHLLKSRMIEKGVSDKVVEQFLQPTVKDAKSQAMKWFLILSGIGLGLTIISFFLPIGLHSVAIMTLSIALSFLSYFYFLKRSGN